MGELMQDGAAADAAGCDRRAVAEAGSGDLAVEDRAEAIVHIRQSARESQDLRIAY